MVWKSSIPNIVASGGQRDAGSAALRVHREGYVDGTPKTMVFQVVERTDAVRVGC